MANLITLARVLLLFVPILVWARKTQLHWWGLDLAMVVLLAVVIFLDAVDGWVARKRHEDSESGAMIDIAGDRIVELVLWVFFAVRRGPSGEPLVPYWVPVAIVTRTVLTDMVRSLAFQKGKTPFGKKTMMETRWARELTASRWSRASYGILKAVAFCALGVVLALDRMGAHGGFASGFRVATNVLVYATAVFAIVRGIPVLWDGRRYLFGLSLIHISEPTRQR
ncbi:MAG: CDP-alcohol phosphatidyltransferase family protein, partial [Candidatus Eisenbacteria bacterium]|nr:CDP-alcohol phosphatidyltransferase family protein [Candidatus Eisenbacteria bacterium]